MGFWLMILLLLSVVMLIGIFSCLVLRIFKSWRAAHTARRTAEAEAALLPTGEEAWQQLEHHLVEVERANMKFTDSCSICLGEFESTTPDTPLVRLPCDHMFHRNCIKGWVTYRGIYASCPLCKRPIKPPPRADETVVVTSTESASPAPVARPTRRIPLRSAQVAPAPEPGPGHLDSDPDVEHDVELMELSATDILAVPTAPILNEYEA